MILLPMMCASEVASEQSIMPTVRLFVCLVFNTRSIIISQIQLQLSLRSSLFSRGGEDDELQLRCKALGVSWDYPKHPKYQNTIKDLEEMDLHTKLKFLKSHQEWKCLLKKEALEEHSSTWKMNGLSSLAGYKILKETPLDTSDLNQSKATKITVDIRLNGDHWTNKQAGVNLTYKDL
jgi:hypothetical protein